MLLYKQIQKILIVFKYKFELGNYGSKNIFKSFLE